MHEQDKDSSVMLDSGFHKLGVSKEFSLRRRFYDIAYIYFYLGKLFRYNMLFDYMIIQFRINIRWYVKYSGTSKTK